MNCLRILWSKPELIDPLIALQKRAKKAGNPLFLTSLPPSSFAQLAEEGKVLLAKGPYDLLGGIALSHSVSDLFPEGKSQREIDDFLFSLDYQGEDIAVILDYFVDPSIPPKRILDALFASLLSSKKESHLFARVPLEQTEAMRYLASQGFLASKPIMDDKEPHRIFFHPKKRDGICSSGNW